MQIFRARVCVLLNMCTFFQKLHRIVGYVQKKMYLCTVFPNIAIEICKSHLIYLRRIHALSFLTWMVHCTRKLGWCAKCYVRRLLTASRCGRKGKRANNCVAYGCKMRALSTKRISEQWPTIALYPQDSCALGTSNNICR